MEFPLSPSAIQVSLRTSTVQARNCMTGTAMILFKKIDVNGQVSPTVLKLSAVLKSAQA
jgi:hypothetical protein